MAPGGERRRGGETAALDNANVPWYQDTMKIERIQTGIRLEKRLLKVLKGLAELKDIGLGDLVEGIVLHAFEGKAPFSAETLAAIERLKAVYGLDLTAADAHRLEEEVAP